MFQNEELHKLAKVFAHIGGNALPTQEDIEKGVPELLELFDSNSDGTIARDEFASAYMKISGFTSAETFESPLTEKEFLKSVSAQFPLLFMDSGGTPLSYAFVWEQYAKAFDRFDTNGDGVFQEEELQKIAIEFAKLGGMPDMDEDKTKAAVQDTRQLFDLDSDGQVTRKEFADQYMKISGFEDADSFSSPVTEDQFLASMEYSCPLLFGSAE